MDILKKIFIVSFLIAAFAGFAIPIVFAAEKIKPSTIKCVPGLPCIQESTQQGGQTAVREYVTGTFGKRFLVGFLAIAGVTSVIFIIVGGMQMHLAMGNEEAITKAKKTLLWAIFGLVIAILSVAIVQIVTTLPFTPQKP